MVNVHGSSLLLACLIGMAGCGDPTPPPATAQPAPTFGQTSVAGTVHFVGTPPQLRVISTAETCVGGPSVVTEETVVVSRDGGLRDVIVYLKDAPVSSGESLQRVQLDQNGCQYKPHVVAVQQGQGLAISTHDSVFHNVHWLSQANGDANLGFPPNSGTQVHSFNRPDFIRIRCDVHPWMEAYVGVISNPFFAVSDAAGHFEIRRVPAGHYTLAAWHPLLGERTQPIDVGPDGKVEANFEYAKPSS